MTDAVCAVLIDLEDRYGDHYYPDAARIIRELSRRWFHAGRTIRRLRYHLYLCECTRDDVVGMLHKFHRRWQWERRKAERWQSAWRIMRDNVVCTQGERESNRRGWSMALENTRAMEIAGAEQAKRADDNREWALRVEAERDALRARCERLAKALRPYEREHARPFRINHVDCQCDYCKAARAALKEAKP